MTCGFFECIPGSGAPTATHVALSPWFGRRAPWEHSLQTAHFDPSPAACQTCAKASPRRPPMDHGAGFCAWSRCAASPYACKCAWLACGGHTLTAHPTLRERERERERERLSTHQHSAFCNGRHRRPPPHLLKPSDGPTHLHAYARRITLERANPSVAAAMTAGSTRQQSGSFFCSNRANRSTKKVLWGESLKCTFLALHAAYETQTQLPAT